MFSSVAPDGPVGEFVASLWPHEDQDSVPGADLRLPTGAVELVINLSADRFSLPDRAGGCRRYPGAVVAGPYRCPYLLETAEQAHVAGVVFRPGGARAVLGVPLAELADRHVALDDLWGAEAARVRERMLTAPDAAGGLSVLTAALGERVAGQAELAHPLAAVATRWLSRAPEHRRLGELADRLGWSARRVQQVFRAEVGLSPKAYQRLARFRATLTSIDAAAGLGWPAFAAERGYYDQAHLIREFRAHAGLSPTTYLQRRGEQLNHVPLPW